MGTVPVDESISAEGHLQTGHEVHPLCDKNDHTNREMSPTMTIPRSHVNLFETLAKVWPPMIQLRMRKHCKLTTFKTLGTIDPKYLPPHGQQK